MIQEFKDFINRGNVVDLAVAVVIGAAFSRVIDSFVSDIFGGILGAIGGEPDLSSLTFELGDGVIRYGSFLSAVISFLIVAFAIFLVVKAINAAQGLRSGASDAEVVEEELDVLREIRDLLRQQR